jgi:hypothetical protein
LDLLLLDPTALMPMGFLKPIARQGYQHLILFFQPSRSCT